MVCGLVGLGIKIWLSADLELGLWLRFDLVLG